MIEKTERFLLSFLSFSIILNGVLRMNLNLLQENVCGYDNENRFVSS